MTTKPRCAGAPEEMDYRVAEDVDGRRLAGAASAS